MRSEHAELRTEFQGLVPTNLIALLDNHGSWVDPIDVFNAEISYFVVRENSPLNSIKRTVFEFGEPELDSWMTVAQRQAEQGSMTLLLRRNQRSAPSPEKSAKRAFIPKGRLLSSPEEKERKNM